MSQITMLSTIRNSRLETFYPEGWDLERIDQCCSHSPDSVLDPQPWWNQDFKPMICETIEEFDAKMGYEIARTIQECKQEGKKLALILPVGPMGMYKWTVYFLKEWNLSCEHVFGFNMDEWSDAQGETLPGHEPGAFQDAMEKAFFGPLGNLTIPENQRFFATKEVLPTYPERINNLLQEGAKLVVVFGIGRACHIAFWEPHFAAEFSEEEWKKQTHRLGAQLHPLTIEQNAITSFRGRYTLIPCNANTIGPGLFLKADKIIGGCDGAFGNGMQWQGPSLWITLRYGPDIWLPSTFMPTLPGKLFFLRELAGPLVPDCH